MNAWLSRFRGELNNVRLTLLITLLFTMLVASIFPTPAIRYMVALLCAGPFVGFVSAWTFGHAIQASRQISTTATVGDLVTGSVTMRNSAPFPVFFAEADIGEACVPGNGVAVSAVEGKKHIITMLRPYEEICLPLHWRMARRGIWTLPGLRSGATDPLGVSSWSKRRSESHDIVVLPRPLRVFRLGFLTGSQQGSRPISHAARVTEAVDFHGIREWRPGEGIRRLHWKSTARTGRLHVVEWEEDLSADLTILFDTYVPDGPPAGTEDRALETCVTLAASVAAHLLNGGYSVDLFCFSGGELCHVRAHGSNGIGVMLRALAAVSAQHETSADFASLAAQAAHPMDTDRSILAISRVGNETDGGFRSLDDAGVDRRHCTLFMVEPSKASNDRSYGSTRASAEVSGARIRTRMLRPSDSLVAALERE